MHTWLTGLLLRKCSAPWPGVCPGRCNWMVMAQLEGEQDLFTPKNRTTFDNNPKPGCDVRDMFMRIERQTLSRMPAQGHVLFTIHAHQVTCRRRAWRCAAWP